MTTITVDTGGHKDHIFIARLSYVLDFIRNHPCAPDGIVIVINEIKNTGKVIHYSVEGGAFQIVPQKVFFVQSQILLSQPKEIALNVQNHLLKGFANNGGSKFMPFDIFETIFFHISRYEEWFVVDNHLDQHGTLDSNHQYLVKNNLQQTPIVDLLVLYFLEKIQLQPKEIETKYMLSHDIDVLQKYPSFYKFLRGYGNIICYQPNKIKNIIRLTSSYINFILGKQTDPYDTFEWLLQSNHPNISKKIIYWLTGGNTSYEGFFGIFDPKVGAIIQKSAKQGYRIGLHPSYNTISDKVMMGEELETLCQVASLKINDIRQHFLRFEVKRTGKILDELGIKTDSSLGYRDRIGFRCGTGFPYRLYNFEAESAFNFFEIPLVVMDIAAMREADWNSSAWCDLITSFLERNKNATHITFNFHNSFFDPALVDADLIKTWYIKTFNVET